MEQFKECGFAILSEVVSPSHCDALSEHLDQLLATQLSLKAGVRDLFRHVPELSQLVRRKAIRSLVERVLGPNAFAVRAILFDKTSKANWYVAWHQDTTIAVKTKHEVAGYDGWSEKDGIPHVRPPLEVLEQMVTVRLHLDHCDSENGALRVIPGSHRSGILSKDEIDRQVDELGERVCTVKRGGGMVMSPLLLHASSKATQPKRRRVIHLEFASIELAESLDWYERR